MQESLTPKRLIADSLRHHRRIHIAVALGTAAATAVLTGALLVGDSVRGSLKHTALDRLGAIDEVLVTQNLFREQLAEELNAAGPPKPAVAASGLYLVGGASHPQNKSRAAGVNILGFTDEFREAFYFKRETGIRVPQDNEIILNQTLADELQAKVGDDVILRLASAGEVPEESPLGRKTDTVASSQRLKVLEVVPSTGIGAFSLRPNQQVPKNAYVSLAVMQRILDKPQKINAVFIRGQEYSPTNLTLEQSHETLTHSLKPKLADYGLAWTKTKPGYFNLASDRMLIDPPTEQAVLEAYGDLQPQKVYTYLANTIASGGKEIPYSTIAAMDFVDRAPLGPFRTPDGAAIGPIADGEIVLNRWAAEDLGVQPGAEVRIDYFEPESTHAEVKEASATFKLKAIVDLKAKDDPFLTPDLTPELPGVTDQLKMGDWDPPFPYDGQRVRRKDEDYWDDYRATPKAFVNYATGRKLWGSRFGELTSIRVVPKDGMTVESLAAKFQPDPASLGFAFQPVRLRAIEASSGTTPFEGLFIGFSFFIIAAAVMLTMLLFKLGVEQRAAEVGLMLALGLGLRRVSRLLLIEGTIVAAIGAAIGLALGVGYALLMLAGLRTLWLDAVTVPFLDLYVTPKSLLIGYGSGVVVSVLAIWWSLRALKRLSVRRLLSNQAAESDLAPAANSAE
ncbi:MAG: FtsX-like permease family protein, partial [Planctomycetales bacterium]|nr:FtsX-like permease family protein [Planctomycetales bacterium]